MRILAYILAGPPGKEGTMGLALEGVTVLDVGTLTPGKYCTFLLGDLGAEVIRIERPVPGAAPQSGHLSDEDLILNRNKRSITLNLKTDEARRVFYQLLDKADVILESYRPGVTKRMGIDYETVKKTHPRIVYCAISGYGQEGPYCQLPGFDLVFTAIGGLLSLIGGSQQPPRVPGVYLADTAAGMFSAFGIVTALLARERTSMGQLIDISMLDSVVSWLSLGHGVQPVGGRSDSTVRDPMADGQMPGYGIYKTGDERYLALGIGRQQSWESLCRALGREDLADHQMATGEKREGIASFLEQAFMARTREEWLELLRPLDIEVGPVNDPAEAFSDPQVLHRQTALELDHPIRGKTRQVGLPVKLSETPGAVRRAAPVIGQDTEETLRELGYTESAIEELRRAQAI
jgi:crotonobetainyl-CoA:carnitine CoA-transferase CaiB-like acyl-CoA transferase